MIVNVTPQEEEQIRLELSQKQSDAWHYLTDTETTEILYGGGAGGGKSYLGCIWHIDRRVRYAQTRGLIGRKELKSIKESTLITYLKVAQVMGYRAGIDFKYNSQDMVINWANGSRTVFKELKQEPSDPNFEGLGSTEYTDVFVDEAGEIVEKAFDILSSRIRWMLDVYGLVPKFLMTCNPNFNWIKYKYIKTKKNEYVTLKPYQKYVRALVDDNPNEKFKALYREQLEKMNEYDKARLLHGDWDAIPRTGGEFYKKFDSKTHTGICKYNPRLALHLSWDENRNPYLPCGVFQIEGNVIKMVDLFLGKFPDNDITSVCNDIKGKYFAHKSGVFIYGDATSRKGDAKVEKGYDFFKLVAKELRSMQPQMRVEKSNPSVVMRGNFFNAVLDTNISNISFMIDSVLHEAIMDFEQTKEAADGTKDKKIEKDPLTGVSFQKHGHITDLSDYLLCTAFKTAYLSFQSGGPGGKDRAVGYNPNNTDNSF